ncbi:Phosphate-selective porin [Flexibacter flexilis DSM 6793]|uniref:Phosphate-selective porin n=1 Tax=Flexibacter flexilis DSM 6793 TaxID=927664 RepID=A0A1I1GPF0_9BACT|nr:porin [Flexibacter flexilis]SFC13162.1 Phosphate-selective porin [Flexibacter flexilis DSM 6793]
MALQCFSFVGFAQNQPHTNDSISKKDLDVYIQKRVEELLATRQSTEKAVTEKKWYEVIGVRGYIQTRYNRLLETNDALGCEQCDKSWGRNGGFFIRRARIVFSGQISPTVFFSLQPDFASSVFSDKVNFLQLRDAYMDIGLEKTNQFRVRIGQSKIPFGFENLQSSQNRLPLDRNDGLNSAALNERDLGVFFYWASTKQRKLFSFLANARLKGSGDYGVFAFGVYNGQNGNMPELNDKLYAVARLTWPFKIKEQIFETSVQAYSGKYVIPQVSTGVSTTNNNSYRDQRLAGSFIMYAQPFGFQAEYSIGNGPTFDKNTLSIRNKKQSGGYVQTMYRLDFGKHILFPFARYSYFDGGKKYELDARSYQVNDIDIGLEWQPYKQFELVAMYAISKRRYEDFSKQNNLQQGRLLRLQAQLNF